MAKRPEDRYSTAGDLAVAALQALTATEQQKAAAILQHGDTRSPGAAEFAAGSAPRMMLPPDATVAAPVAFGADGGWRGQAVHPAPVVPPVFTGPARHNRFAIIGAAVLLVLAVAGVTGYLVTRPSHSSADWTTATGQSVLPFNGLTFRLSPGGVTLDGDGNIYVTNQVMTGRVVKLAPGSSSPMVLPFTGLYEPQGVAVDSSGAVYASDFNNRVVKLDVGANTQTELPFTGLTYPEGVAVDSAGSVYVADRGNDRVVKLATGSTSQTVLPFTGLQNPDGVAVDSAGSVYVTDSDNDRVVKLAAGATGQTVLPFTGLSVPWGIAVDSAGTVYVTEHEDHKVVTLAAGSNSSAVLPIDGLNTPLDVAVDKSGNVYVADRGNDRVVRLAAH